MEFNTGGCCEFKGFRLVKGKRKGIPGIGSCKITVRKEPDFYYLGEVSF